MSLKTLGLCVSASILLVVAGAAAAVDPAADAPQIRIPVGSVEVEAVPAWDPASQQKLVRVAGVLYQEEADFLYPVDTGVVTVRLADGVDGWSQLVQRARRSGAAYDLLEQLVPERVNRLGIVDLRIPAGDPTEWCALLHASGLVRYAEVNTHGVWTITPDDPQYGSQWALNNTGQTGGTTDADVDAPEAWDLSAGDPAIIVGVLDSGTYVDHVDLAINVWINEDEIPGNSIDDDANGYVDDWEGWDFGNNNNDPRSNNFHGTHVTGIINAATSNGIGISGLAGGFGGPGVRGMALAVGEGGPNGGVLDDAIIYAADNGAHVITMSLTVGSSAAINDALDYAYNTQDVFIDCAAGNNGSSVGYPANRPEVMAVASSDDDDNKSSFSNPGPEVEVTAPGSSVISTQLNNTYGSSSGTSFAAPYVAALAALVRGLNPGLPAQDVRQLLIDSAEDISTPGFDEGTGFGRINAFDALASTATSDGTVRLDRNRYACTDSLTVTLADLDLAGSGSQPLVLRSDLEPLGEAVSVSETGPGSGVFRGTFATEEGAASADGLLQVLHADSVVVEYSDADNGMGGNGILKTATAVTDCQGPLISNIEVTSVDDTGATITWLTDENGSSTVRYGEFVPDTEVSQGGLTVNHAVSLNGLAACTSYKFEVQSDDDLGNAFVEDNGGIYFSFETFGNFPGVGIGPCHQGQVALDKNTYGCSDTVSVSVTDIDLDTDSGSIESIQVLMTSTSEPDGEWITLTEEGSASNVFSGNITLGGAAAADGLLAGSAGDLISATYFDTDDGEGSPRISSFTSMADCVAPKIANLRVTAVSATRAEIEWSTDEPSTSRVEYGADAGLGSVVEDLTLKTAHRLVISAFESCDRVFFRVAGADALGDLAIGDAAGSPYEFNLRQIGGLVFHDNFESDAGWNLRGEWERVDPQGLGSSGADPDAAWSGQAIIGTDLTGQGAFPGDYEPVVKDWAISPAFDASSASNLEVVLRRKLGVTGSDSASIGVFAPGENIAWTSAGAINDADWVETRHDISGLTDGLASVQIAFGVQSEDTGQSYGWNVDEVIVKDATQPDYLECGGCAGTPTFAGLLSVADLEPCAAGGLLLQWEAAAAWGTGGAGTYDVHRGTTSAFTPDTGNRIASGIATTSFTDVTAPTDTPVWYVVRARNDENCGGEGLAETNEVRLGATETGAQPLPGTIADSLEVTMVGEAHVRLSWAPVAGADRYAIRRGLNGEFVALVDVAETGGTFYEDVNTVQDGNFYAYRVIALNACGQEAP